MLVSIFTLAIIQLHALSLLQKTVQIRDQFFLYMDPAGPNKKLCTGLFDCRHNCTFRDPPPPGKYGFRLHEKFFSNRSLLWLY